MFIPLESTQAKRTLAAAGGTNTDEAEMQLLKKRKMMLNTLKVK